MSEPATETACPCLRATKEGWSYACAPCKEANVHLPTCTTSGCVYGKIQVEESTDG